VKRVTGGDFNPDGLDSIAAKLKVDDVTTPLRPDQVSLLENSIKRQTRGGGRDEAVTQTSQTGDTTETSINGTGTSPRSGEGAGGAVAGAPGPVATPPTPNQRVAGAFQPATTPTAPTPVRTTREPAVAQAAPSTPRTLPRTMTPPVGLKPGETPQAAFDRINGELTKLDQASVRASMMPGAAGATLMKTLQDRAARLQEDKKSITEYVNKQNELTEPEKKAQASGTPGGSPLTYEAQQEGVKKREDYFGKVLQGFNGAANASAGALKNINLARSLVNVPNFFSGTLEGANLQFKRLQATLAQTEIGRRMGLDPNAPLSQEAFRKVMSANLLQQATGMRSDADQMGEQAGRIFKQYADYMEAAAQKPENTIAANRTLTEISYRSAMHAIETAREVNRLEAEYRTSHGGNVNYELNDKITAWIEKHPMFTDEEMAHPEQLGAPTMPKGAAINKDAMYAWAKGVGLQKGDPVRTPDGIKYMHIDPATWKPGTERAGVGR
jgi:hypothetical protein